MVGDTLLRRKGKGRGIMFSELLLSFARLRLSRLFWIQQEEIIRNTGLKINEAVEILEYGKNNDRYWEALYLGYSILFMFDNATSHLVYAEDELYAYKMNKGPGDKQVILCNGWYVDQMDMYHI